MNPNEIVDVLLEYDHKNKRVIVRGVFEPENVPRTELLTPGNEQNLVSVFAGHLMDLVAFSSLVPDDYDAYRTGYDVGYEAGQHRGTDET